MDRGYKHLWPEDENCECETCRVGFGEKIDLAAAIAEINKSLQSATERGVREE